MDNVKVKGYTSLVMVVNMKDLGVMGDMLVLAFVHGKMVVVTKGTSRRKKVIDDLLILSFTF